MIVNVKKYYNKKLDFTLIVLYYKEKRCSYVGLES